MFVGRKKREIIEQLKNTKELIHVSINCPHWGMNSLNLNWENSYSNYLLFYTRQNKIVATIKKYS